MGAVFTQLVAVIARSAATKQSIHRNWMKARWMDCFASLAMTGSAS